MPAQRYDRPWGKVELRFVRTLSKEIRGVRSRRWNTEWFIFFQTVILKHDTHSTASHAIQRQIGKLLNTWEAGQHQILVEETARTCKKNLTKSQQDESEEHWAK